MLAVLAAALLMNLVATTAEARMPRATHYRAGGPITLDTNLLSVSGVSAWAIDEYLKASTSLPPLGAAFIAAEKKYGINARFLLAAALHESGWGSGYIARIKHNLFGYNAYDRDPLRYANAYATYAANIDATARFIKDSYLTRGGRWWGGAADAAEHAAVLVLVAPLGGRREPHRDLDPPRHPSPAGRSPSPPRS